MKTKSFKIFCLSFLAFLGMVIGLILLVLLTMTLFDPLWNYLLFGDRSHNSYDTAWMDGKTIEEVVERYGEPHKCLSDPGHDEMSPHRSEECRYFENGHGGEDVDFVRCFVDENGIVYNVESAFGWG